MTQSRVTDSTSCRTTSLLTTDRPAAMRCDHLHHDPATPIKLLHHIHLLLNLVDQKTSPLEFQAIDHLTLKRKPYELASRELADVQLESSIFLQTQSKVHPRADEFDEILIPP